MAEEKKMDYVEFCPGDKLKMRKKLPPEAGGSKAKPKKPDKKLNPSVKADILS